MSFFGSGGGTAQQPSTGLFGGTTSSLFGNTAGASNTTNVFGTAAQAQSPSTGLFGNTQPQATTGLFGNTSAPNNTGSTSIFGSNTQQTGGGLFGSAQPNTGTTGGLFGATQQPTATGGGLFASTQQPANTSGGLFGTSQQQTGTGGGLFGSTQPATGTSGGLFGSTQPATGTSGGLFGSTQPATGTSGGLFGSTQPATGTSGGLFGSTQPATGTSGGLFGSTQPATGTSGGLFGSTQQGAGTSGGLFGSTQPATGTAGGLFGSTQQGAGSGGGLFGNAQQAGGSGGGLFGSTQGTGGGLFGSTQQQTGGLFGSIAGGTSGGGLFGNTQQGTGGLFGGGNTGTSGGLFGGQKGGAWPSSSGLGLASPFGLGVNTAPIEQQREMLRQQMLACGVDVNALPGPLQAVLPKIQNPNMRTLQLLVKLIARVTKLQEIKEQNQDLTCFVFSKAPSADVALRLQAICDQQAASAGPQMLQKLTRAKKKMPEPRMQFFTELLVGFNGLQCRIKDQATFFATFAATLSDLQKRQKKSHEDFREQALEKLTRIRKAQTTLKDNLISLVGSLDELAIRAQGFEGDEHEVSQIEEDYEKIQRQLTSAPESLLRSLPSVQQRLKEVQKAPKRPPSSAMTIAQPRLSVPGGRNTIDGSNECKNAHEELLQMAARQHEEIEKIKKRMAILVSDVQENMLQRSV